MYHIRKCFTWWRGIPSEESQSRFINPCWIKGSIPKFALRVIDPHVPQTLKQPPECLGPNALEFLTSFLCESYFQKECIHVDLAHDNRSMNSQNDPYIFGNMDHHPWYIKFESMIFYIKYTSVINFCYFNHPSFYRIINTLATFGHNRSASLFSVEQACLKGCFLSPSKQ